MPHIYQDPMPIVLSLRHWLVTGQLTISLREWASNAFTREQRPRARALALAAQMPDALDTPEQMDQAALVVQALDWLANPKAPRLTEYRCARTYAGLQRAMPSEVMQWRAYETYLDLEEGIRAHWFEEPAGALIERLEAMSASVWMTPEMRYALAYEGNRLLIMKAMGSTPEELAREEAGMEGRLMALGRLGDRRLGYRLKRGRVVARLW
ncbi:MAG: hypothetical protein ABI542_07685 [Gemmatimonadota bacterium]